MASDIAGTAGAAQGVYRGAACRSPYTRALAGTAALPLPAGVAPLVRASVERALQKRPAERFTSAAELARALERALARLTPS